MNPFALSMDKGLRENMEDNAYAFLFTPISGEPAVVLMVADGVGGRDAGDIASALAALNLSRSLAGALVAVDAADIAPGDMLETLTRAVDQTNTAIASAAASNSQYHGMASTIVCAVILDRLLYLTWVGDSRCYLYRDGRVEQISRDHSAVQQLIASGLLDPQQAKNHPLAHVITRYLGQTEDFTTETILRHIRSGDLLLLCSDGLSDVISDEQIARRAEDCVGGKLDLPALAQTLVSDALAAGTTDNVTVLCYRHPPSVQSQNSSSEPTLTGAYPAEMARVLQSFREESYVK